MHDIGYCEYPLRTSPRVAGELFQLRKIVVTRRLERHGWPSEYPPDAGHQMRDYCRDKLRTIDNDYRRSARQWPDPAAAPEDPAKLPEGTRVEAPLEDESATEAPQWPVSRHPRLCPAGLREPSPEGTSEYPDARTIAR